MPSSATRTWTPTPLEPVVAVATDAARLSEWLPMVRPAAVPDALDLGQVGTRLDVDWQLGNGGRGRLTTVRRVRDVLHLDAEHHAGGHGHLCISLSPWDGGTMVELVADLDGWPVGQRQLRRHLRRSARRLPALAEAQAQRPATTVGTASAHGGRLGLTPEHDAGAVPTS